jgi:hypothetical protein
MKNQHEINRNVTKWYWCVLIAIVVLTPVLVGCAFCEATKSLPKKEVVNPDYDSTEVEILKD